METTYLLQMKCSKFHHSYPLNESDCHLWYLIRFVIAFLSQKLWNLVNALSPDNNLGLWLVWLGIKVGLNSVGYILVTFS